MSTSMDNYDNEIIKWRKKGHSSISQASKKANHKHDWQPAIVMYRRKPNALYNSYHEVTKEYGLGVYCSICNKVKLQKWWYNEDGKLYSDIWSLKKKFPTYPVKESDEMW